MCDYRALGLRFKALLEMSVPKAMLGFPGGSAVKNPPANTGDAGSILGSGRSFWGRHDNLLQCSCLGNPMDRGPWRAAVHRVTEAGLSSWAHRKAMLIGVFNVMLLFKFTYGKILSCVGPFWLLTNAWSHVATMIKTRICFTDPLKNPSCCVFVINLFFYPFPCQLPFRSPAPSFCHFQNIVWMESYRNV